MWFYGWEHKEVTILPTLVTIDIAEVDIRCFLMFLVAEVQDSTCPHLNPLLAFTTKAHVMLTDAKFQDVDT